MKKTFVDNPFLSWMWSNEWKAWDVKTFFPVDIAIPRLLNTDELLEKIPSVDQLYLDVEPAYEIFIQSIKETEENIQRAARNFRNGVEFRIVDFVKLPDFLPEDYSPPQYIGLSHNVSDLDTETQLHNNATKVCSLVSSNHLLASFFPALSISFALFRSLSRDPPEL